MIILTVDDSPTSLNTTAAYIKALGHSPICADSGKSALEILKTHTVDLIFLDVIMDDMDGYETAIEIRSSLDEERWVPIVFISSQINSDSILKGIESGGDDYITKPINATVLEAKIKAMERIAKMQKDIIKMNEQLAEISLTDRLTGIANRYSFEKVLDRCILHAKLKDEIFAVLYIDLDRFKTINDTLGHHAGDLLLKETCLRIQKIIRPTDYFARVGGDEFIIILSNLSDPYYAGTVAKKITEQFITPFNIKSNQINSTCSIGIACYPTAGNNAETLTQHADIAMYRAKESGRNQYHYFSQELNSEHSKRLMIEQELMSAIGKDEFSMVYQPKFDLKSKQVCGLEALIRWHNNKLGPGLPDDFIPLCEKLGIIGQLGQWILEETLSTFSHWHKEHPSLRLAINISPIQLNQPGFASTTIHTIEQHNVPFDTIDLEITETAIMAYSQQIEGALEKLHNAGIKIDIDDFGTGYSSLSHIKRLPIDGLKVDKEFVMDLERDQNDATIVKTIIDLAKNLNLSIIAEGIETQEQMNFLLENGCETGQGFFLAKPMEPDKISILLSQQGHA